MCKSARELLAFGLEEAKVRLSLVLLNLGSYTPPTSAVPPRFDPKEVKVMYLRCICGEASAMFVISPLDFVPKMLMMMSLRQQVAGRV